MVLDEELRRRQKRRNTAQALLLLGGMVSILGGLAWLLFGPFGTVWAIVLGSATLVLRPSVPPAWQLSMYGARPLPPTAAPGLHRAVRLLAKRAGLPTSPTVHYVRSPMMNAFAVGRRDDAAIALTDGLLRGLSDRELLGVLAHELAHVRADDLWIMSLSDTIARISHPLAYTGVIVFVLALPATVEGAFALPALALLLMSAPTLVTLLQLALSRAREYDADLEAATLTGDPHGLAAALQRLQLHEGRIWERIMIPHRRSPDPLLLRTHPPTAERVRRLRELRSAESGVARLEPPTFGMHHADPAPPPVRLRPPGIRW